MSSETYGFPKRYRLNRPGDYTRVLRSAGFRRNCGPLRILAVANTMPGARLGLIIGKRAVRLAHERNLLKRVAREVFRMDRQHLPGVDIVLHLRGPIGRRELRSMLKEQFSAIAETTGGAPG